jgi:transposase
MPRPGLRVSDTQAEELIQAYRVATARKDFALRRRIQGLLLVSSGMAQLKAADIVGVKRRTLQEWLFKYRRGGLAALKKGPYPGRSPKLTKTQLEELGRIIEQGPESVGLDSGVWTAPLAVDLVNRLFGVKYHPDHMRKILKRLDPSVQ